MDGENNGKPYEQMDDLVVFPIIIFGNIHMEIMGVETRPEEPHIIHYESYTFVRLFEEPLTGKRFKNSDFE